MARTNTAELLARIASLEALIKASPAAPSEASEHFKARDLPCTFAKPCTRTFRTVKGQAWHLANMKEQHKA